MKAVNRDSDKLIIRLPEGMRDRIKTSAAANGRSMNTEINAILDAYYNETPDLPTELRRIADLLELKK